MNTKQTASPTHLTSTAVLFCFISLLIFSAEVSIMELMAGGFLTYGTFVGSVLDSLVLVIVYSPALWFLIIRPLYGKHAVTCSGVRVSPVRLFFKVQLVVFLVELTVDLTLALTLPGLPQDIGSLADAGLTVLACAPFMWQMLFKPAYQASNGSLTEALSIPVKINILLICMVFLVDFVEDLLMPYIFFDDNILSHKIVDSFLTALLIAPFVWRIVARPLKMTAVNEKRLADAVRYQVVDAVLTVDRNGMIESINPAAERIFGFLEAEVAGGPVQNFFRDHLLCDDKMRRVIDEAVSGRLFEHSFEVSCRHKNGTPLVADITLSRIIYEDYEQFLVIMRDISSRKRMEDELRESKQRYELAVIGSHDGIWDWDIRTGVMYYSPRLVEMLGYRDGGLESSFERFLSLVHHDDRARVADAVQSHLDGRMPFDAEFRMRTSVGEDRWFRARGQAVWDNSGRAGRMAGSVSDITERREKDNALRESERRFRQIFEQSEDAIIFFKPGTCSIIDVNQTAEKMYGFTKAELLERGVENFCPPSDQQRLAGMIRKAGTAKLSILERIVNRRKDGAEITVSARCKIITIQGVEITYCTFRDITDRILMEEEARNIQAKLIQANKMTSLGLLVSGVAHEINNPNNFIMANSQLLSKVWQDSLKILREYYRENGDFQLGGIPFSVVNEDSSQLFNGITEGSRRINDIVNNLKNFSRQDRSAANHAVNVNQVVTTSLTILHHQIMKHTENIHVDLAEDIPTVRGSSQQLEQVVINLVMNACQALPGTQNAIWVTTGRDEQTGQVLISVRDEGIGMPASVCSQVLEPFFTTKLDSGGTGLGLSISHSIVKEHDGTLEFVSEPGKGTTVVVRLPAGEPAVQEQSP